MILNRLLLRNFRNWANATVVFSPGVNLIQGENGQGKTNLLEAIHFISTGRSFRTSSLSDLIQFGQRFFYLEAHFVKDGVAQVLKVYYDENTRKVQYNQTIHPTLTSLLGILPIVLLSPDDLSLITGSPVERRRFLDLHIAQTDPLYVNFLGRYFKAMKQRNHLLRMKNGNGIEPWEEIMAQSASCLVQKRKEAILALSSPCSAWIQALSRGTDAMTLRYESSPAPPGKNGILTAEYFQKTWQKNREREMLTGSTLSGPHRDDFCIHLDDKPAKTWSSEGQKRSCISSLRFAQWEEMAGTIGHPPLLGIDDFGIQLDSERQNQLKTHFPRFHQVFLTSPHFCGNDFGQTAPPHILTIRKGQLTCI